MSDVFELPVSKLQTSRLVRDQSGQVINNLPNGNEAAMHAINSHDALVAKVDELDKAVLEEIGNRDYWQEKADDLARAAGKFMGIDVGEHSNCNCPIDEAMDWLNTKPECVTGAAEDGVFHKINTLVAENERLKRLVAQYEEDFILLSPTGAP